jgi:hypothetical protein
MTGTLICPVCGRNESNFERTSTGGAYSAMVVGSITMDGVMSLVTRWQVGMVTAVM